MKKKKKKRRRRRGGELEIRQLQTTGPHKFNSQFAVHSLPLFH